MALLWRCVTFGVCRDDVAGRQRLARREPLALGVIQTASGTLGTLGTQLRIGHSPNAPPERNFVTKHLTVMT